MVVDYVVPAFRNNERLSLEICTRKLIEERHYLGYAMLGTCQRVMTRDSPYDVVLAITAFTAATSFFAW